MKVLFVLFTFSVVLVAGDPTSNPRENIVGKTSSVITSSNFVSSSSNINGKVNSASKLDSSVVKSEADIKGRDGVIEHTNPKVEGVKVESLKVTKGTVAGEAEPQLNSRFSNFESENEYKVDEKVTHNGFVQIKNPVHRRIAELQKSHPHLANRFRDEFEDGDKPRDPSNDYQNKPLIKPSENSQYQWSETRRILDEILLLQLLDRLNYRRTLSLEDLESYLEEL